MLMELGLGAWFEEPKKKKEKTLKSYMAVTCDSVRSKISVVTGMLGSPNHDICFIFVFMLYFYNVFQDLEQNKKRK